MTEQGGKWQGKLDADFPWGLLATWSDRTSDIGGIMHVYLVPRAEVIGMRGLDPLVALPTPDHDKVIEPGVIVAYEVIQTTPCKLIKVTFATGRTMLWSDGLTQVQKEQNREHRDAAIAVEAELGHSAWTPVP